MICRFDREAEDYLTDDDKPCRHDDYGDPTYHCTARRTCSQHIGPDDLTCARCVGRARVNLRRIPPLATLMPAAAIEAGVDSEAASLAGPSTHPGAWGARRVAMRAHLAYWERSGKITEAQHLSARATMEDDDDLDPYLLLGRWDLMLREDYDQPSDKPITVNNAATYLDHVLGRVAQDSDQDFAQLARELRACRNHLETQLAILQMQHRGAPCPDCTTEDDGVGPRLVRHFGHWCEDDDCERLHYSLIANGETGELMPDTAGDEWVCPRNKGHRWNHATYEKWITDRKTRSRSAS